MQMLQAARQALRVPRPLHIGSFSELLVGSPQCQFSKTERQIWLANDLDSNVSSPGVAADRAPVDSVVEGGPLYCRAGFTHSSDRRQVSVRPAPVSRLHTY